MLGDEGLEWIGVSSCSARAVARRSALRLGRPEVLALLLGGGNLLRILRVDLRHHLRQALALGLNAQAARDLVGLHGVGAPVGRALSY